MSQSKNPHYGGSWEELREQLFTSEERAECDLHVKVIGKLIEARDEQNISQRALAEKTGIKQPVIARIERGTSTHKVSTLLKLLQPLGYTLDVVPLADVGRERAHG